MGGGALIQFILQLEETDRETERWTEGRSGGEKGSGTTDVWEHFLLEEDEEDEVAVVIFDTTAAHPHPPLPFPINK